MRPHKCARIHTYIHIYQIYTYIQIHIHIHTYIPIIILRTYLILSMNKDTRDVIYVTTNKNVNARKSWYFHRIFKKDWSHVYYFS